MVSLLAQLFIILLGWLLWSVWCRFIRFLLLPFRTRRLWWQLVLFIFYFRFSCRRRNFFNFVLLLFIRFPDIRLSLFIPLSNMQKLILLLLAILLFDTFVSFYLSVCFHVLLSLHFIDSTRVVDGYFLWTSTHWFLHTWLKAYKLWCPLHRTLHRARHYLFEIFFIFYIINKMFKFESLLFIFIREWLR